MSEFTENEINDIGHPMEIDQIEVPGLKKESKALSKVDHSNGVKNDDKSDDDSGDDDHMDYNDYYSDSDTFDGKDTDPSPIPNDRLMFKDCGGLDKQIK